MQAVLQGAQGLGCSCWGCRRVGMQVAWCRCGEGAWLCENEAVLPNNGYAGSVRGRGWGSAGLRRCCSAAVPQACGGTVSVSPSLKPFGLGAADS